MNYKLVAFIYTECLENEVQGKSQDVNKASLKRRNADGK